MFSLLQVLSHSVLLAVSFTTTCCLSVMHAMMYVITIMLIVFRRQVMAVVLCVMTTVSAIVSNMKIYDLFTLSMMLCEPM